ncbi:MAG TPA: amino acid oxidase, partial [Cytophagales bacterium]|nr:amino acid oxidase [Cytophagales bacterium]
MVFDMPDLNRASSVAAGLFNPITGKRIVKTWKADEMFSYLIDFYRSVEKEYHIQFFNTSPLYTPFKTIEEQNEWMGRSSDADYSRYIEALHTNSAFARQVKNPLGGLLLKQCGYIDTTVFSDALRDYLKRKDALLDEDLHEHELKTDKNAVIYRNWRARRIIFCTGEMAKQTSFFSWLPIRPLKGETLTIATNEPVEVIYNRGVYVVPHLWKVGATYTHDTSPSITEVGKVELTDKLNELIAFPYSVVNQQWGFRPT